MFVHTYQFLIRWSELLVALDKVIFLMIHTTRVDLRENNQMLIFLIL